MINAVTGYLMNLVLCVATLGVAVSGLVWMFSPERAKELLKRIGIAAGLGIGGLILVNAYAHALAAGNPLAIVGLLAVSLTAYVVRMAKQRAGDGMTSNRRRLPGR